MLSRLRGLGSLFGVLGSVAGLLLAATLAFDIRIESAHLDAIYADAGPVKAERPWEKVVVSPGHKAHLEGLKKVPCKDCHQIVAEKFDAPPPERCLECHEEQGHLLHDPKVEGAPLCLECHRFLEPRGVPQPGPWECLRCHGDEGATATEFPRSGQGEAPAVTVHTKEECGQCHRPHPTDGGPATLPADCTECHDKFIARHGSKEATIQLCLDCHLPHQKVADTPARCPECHQNPNLAPDDPNGRARQISAAAVREGGHEACSGCHKDHTFQKADAAACRTCHDTVHVLGEQRVPEHQDCRSCHDPHDARAAARGACVRCHEKVRKTHPDARGSGLCAGCHPVHTLAATGARAVACSGCHRDAGSDRAWHSAKTNCRDCHRPHDFKLKAPEVCRECHRANADRVATNAGHRDCSKCHDPHGPAAGVPECVQCHKEKRIPDRHEVCTSCHDPHTSAREILPMCVGCHEDQAQGPHALGHVACNECHEPHEGKPLRNTPACVSCHKSQKTGLHTDLEGGCRKCHQPHGAASVKKPVCVKCHERPKLPALHQHPKHSECKDCHGGHTAPRADRPTCTRCHEKQVQHEPLAILCTGCHVFGVE